MNMAKSIVQNEIEVVTNIVNERQLRKAQLRALKIFSDAVMPTYGPMGGYTAYSQQTGGKDSKAIYHNYTKDGFTVLKHVEVDKPIESLIKDEVRDICTQVIKSIGDGTTSATILSYLIFNGLMKMQEKGIPKRPVIKAFKKLMKDASERIEKNGRQANLDDIYNIALTSLNGNEDMADIIKQIYEQAGMDVFIDVGISNNNDTITRTYDGMVYDTGFLSPAFINSENHTCELNNVDVFVFESPIDTPAMMNYFDMIVKTNIEKPMVAYQAAMQQGKQYKGEYPTATLIIAPHISRDANSYLDQLINQFSAVPIQNRPPLCVVAGIRNDNDHLLDIMSMTGARFIKKYIDNDSYKMDKQRGLAPTATTIKKFAGHCDKAVIDTRSMRLIKPQEMYAKDEKGNATEEYSEFFKNYIDQLKDQLNKYMETKEELVKIGTLKRRINILQNSMVDLLIGGIGVSDRDSLKDSVEDAVLNCRSAAKEGVGYGANYEGFRVFNDIAMELNDKAKELQDQFDNAEADDEKEYIQTQQYPLLIEKTVCNIILTAYTQLVCLIYIPYFDGNEKKALHYALFSLKGSDESKRMPYNIVTGAFDGKVLTSIKTEPSMLYAISKIITLLFDTNQFILPDPRFNIYEMNENSTISVDNTSKEEHEVAEPVDEVIMDDSVEIQGSTEEPQNEEQPVEVDEAPASNE